MLVAWRLARLGVDVRLFEEHSEAGKPQHCAGIISRRCLRLFALSDKFVITSFNAADIILPSGRLISIGRLPFEPLLVDRVLMEVELARRAVEEGAIISYGSIALRARVSKEGVRAYVHTVGKGNHLVRGHYLVLAEGLKRLILKGLMTRARLLGFIKGLQYDVELRAGTLDPNKLVIFMGRKFSDELFGWLIPINEREARIGTAAQSNVVEHLNKVMRDAESLMGLRIKRIKRVLAGPVNVKGPLERFVIQDKVSIVGDAAGQNKLTTGGGLFYGGTGGLLLSRALAMELLEEGNLRRDYEMAWWSMFGREIRFMRLARRFLQRLDDKSLEYLLVETVPHLSMVKHIDMDFQSEGLMKAAIRLLKSIPRAGNSNIYKVFFRALRAVIMGC